MSSGNLYKKKTKGGWEGVRSLGNCRLEPKQKERRDNSQAHARGEGGLAEITGYQGKVAMLAQAPASFFIETWVLVAKF